MWKVKLDTFKVGNSSLPPLLEQRCNGTAAGLGYLEEGLGFPCKISPSGSEPVTGLSCGRIWKVWRTFRGPLEPLMVEHWFESWGGHWVIPLLTFTLKRQVTYKPSASLLQSKFQPIPVHIIHANKSKRVAYSHQMFNPSYCTVYTILYSMFCEL
jgi:hypothetical protein